MAPPLEQQHCQWRHHLLSVSSYWSVSYISAIIIWFVTGDLLPLYCLLGPGNCVCVCTCGGLRQLLNVPLCWCYWWGWMPPTGPASTPPHTPPPPQPVAFTLSITHIAYHHPMLTVELMQMQFNTDTYLQRCVTATTDATTQLLQALVLNLS